MLTPGVAARSTFSASATTSGPMPSPPTTASLMVREAMPEPYWRARLAASPPLSRRSSATWTASTVFGSDPARPGRARRPVSVSSARRADALSQGYMSYTRMLLIAIRKWTYGQQLTPAAGCRPAVRSGPAAASYEYEAPHDACYGTRAETAVDVCQDGRLS